MIAIQRYTPCIPGSAQTAPVVPDPDGKFVRFTDHEHEIAQFARRIELQAAEIDRLSGLGPR